MADDLKQTCREAVPAALRTLGCVAVGSTTCPLARRAAIGSGVARLSHDASTTLRTLAAPIDEIEASVRGVREHPAWRDLRAALALLDFVVVDAMARVRLTRGRLSLHPTRLRPLVEQAVRWAEAYYRDQVLGPPVRLDNRCDPTHAAVVDPSGLQTVVLNALANSLSAYRNAFTAQRRILQPRITVTSRLETRHDDSSRTWLNVIDDAGGISRNLLPNLGQLFLTGDPERGCGVGMYSILDVIGRMGGEVCISSSTEPTPHHPAGTVLSFRLPASVPREHHEGSVRDRVTVIDDYDVFRTELQSIASKGGTNHAREKTSCPGC